MDEAELDRRADDIAERIAGGFGANRDPKDWAEGFGRYKSEVCWLLREHEFQKSAESVGKTKLAHALERRCRAVRNAIVAIEGLTQDERRIVADSHGRSTDYLEAAMFWSQRPEIPASAFDDAIGSLRVVEVGLCQAIAKLRGEPFRSSDADVVLRRGLALLCRPWLPKADWRAELSTILKDAGVCNIDPGDNRTAFDKLFGVGWLKLELPELARGTRAKHTQVNRASSTIRKTRK